ncbi:MAG: hypothetical protein WDM96_14590 [Lacunisphaera sp.]
MKTHRQGRTGAAYAVTRKPHARRLLATLRAICRQLTQSQQDPTVRRIYREVERELAQLARKYRGAGGRKEP